MGDVIILNLSFFIALLIGFDSFDKIATDHYLLLLFNTNLLWLLIISYTRIYEYNRAFKFEKVFSDLAKSLLFQIMLTSLFIFMIKGYYYSRFHILIFGLLFSFLVSIWRFGFLQYLKYLRTIGYNFRRVIIIGTQPSGYQFMELMNANPEYGFKFLGFFDDRPERYVNRDFIKGAVEDAKKYAIEEKVQEIYCSLPLAETDKINDLMKFCDNNLIRFKILPDFRGFVNKKVNIDFYDFMPVISIRSEPLDNMFNRFMKRAFDFVFSLLVVVFIFSWLFPLIALLIKLSSRGPVFFVQERSGYENTSFDCLKFRTMYIDNKNEAQQATKGDPRITPIGNLLRKSNLDELPQLFQN